MGLRAATSGTWIKGLSLLLGSLLSARLGRSRGDGWRRHWRPWIGVESLVLAPLVLAPLAGTKLP
ncbi:MAG: hypothetical protein WBM08_10140 [Prochlorococcaceae cyanobacterium]